LFLKNELISIMNSLCLHVNGYDNFYITVTGKSASFLAYKVQTFCVFFSVGSVSINIVCILFFVYSVSVWLDSKVFLGFHMYIYRLLYWCFVVYSFGVFVVPCPWLYNPFQVLLKGYLLPLLYHYFRMFRNSLVKVCVYRVPVQGVSCIHLVLTITHKEYESNQNQKRINKKPK